MAQYRYGYQGNDGGVALGGPLVRYEPTAGESRGAAIEDWLASGGAGFRKAADRPLRWLGLADDAGKLRYGRVAGLGTLASLLAAAQQLNDPSESAGRNAAQAAGTGLGGIGGGAAGLALGTALGGPLGGLVGSVLLGSLGSETGKGMASFMADVVEGSPESKARREYEKQARLQQQLELERMRALMPLQDQAANMQIANEVKRAREMTQIEDVSARNRALLQGLLMQQQGAQQQQQAIASALLGTLPQY